MKKSWILLSLVAAFAHADTPQKIDMPIQPPAETTGQVQQGASTSEDMSSTVPDMKDTNWKFYENKIVKTHMRVKSSWLMMEVKETRESGSVSFTLSRLPLVTFAVSREPMQGELDLYLSSASLTDVYPAGFKKMPSSFGGRKAVLVRGHAKDGRLDETYFSTDGHSIYQVSFTAPDDYWKETQTPFADLKQNFRWLP